MGRGRERGGDERPRERQRGGGRVRQLRDRPRSAVAGRATVEAAGEGRGGGRGDVGSGKGGGDDDEGRYCFLPPALVAVPRRPEPLVRLPEEDCEPQRARERRWRRSRRRRRRRRRGGSELQRHEGGDEAPRSPPAEKGTSLPLTSRLPGRAPSGHARGPGRVRGELARASKDPGAAEGAPVSGPLVRMRAGGRGRR